MNGKEQTMKKIFPITWKNTLLLTICFLYIVNFFTNDIVSHLVLSILTIVTFIVCMPKANRFPKIFGSFMFIAGIVILLFKGEQLFSFSEGIVKNLPVLSLIILVPLLSIPFKVGGYFETLHYYVRKMASSSQKMFASISFFLFSFGPILNLGSIRVADEMVKDLKLNPILLAKAYLVGFSTVILWSPYFASVALVLYYLELHVTDYIFIGLTLAVIQLIVGNVLYFIYYKRIERPLQLNFKKRVMPENAEQVSNGRNHIQTISKLIGIMALLMAIVFLLEYVTKWPMMLLISLISILFPFFTTAVTKTWDKTLFEVKSFNKNLHHSMNNEVVMFISAGIFATSLTGTAFANSLNQFLTNVAGSSFLLFCVTVVMIVLILSYIGIHTIVIVTILVTQIDPAVIGTTPEVLALLFMISWSISAALSPVNPFNLLVSSSVGKSSVIVGLKWNGVYMLSMFMIGILIVYLIH